MTLTVMLLATLASAGDVVARVDGVELTRAELTAHASELGGKGGATAQQALDSAILEILLAAEAKRTGLAEAPDVRANLERERRRAAAEVMVATELVPRSPPSDEELRRLYHATSDSVRLKMLVFPTEDAARVNLALVQRTGDLDAATRSAVPGFAAPGGDGPKVRGQLPRALADAAFAVPLGAVGGPVALEAGWGLFKVLERTVGDDAQFASRRDAILEFARRQATDAARQHIRKQLRARAKITVDEAFVNALAKKNDTTRAELEHVVAVVNGTPLRYREVDASVRAISATTGHGASSGLRLKVISNAVDDLLLEEEAVARGYAANPAVVSRLPAIERRGLATALVERVRESVPAPREKDVRSFYKANVAATGASLDEAKGAIVAHLLNVRRGEALEAKARELRARANVSIDRAALGSASGG